jgi:superfamily II DNA or RNA helicase
MSSTKTRNAPELRPFRARDFQRRLDETVHQRWDEPDKRTIAWVETGSGKTKAWIALADHLIIKGLIDYVMVYTPRLNLCEQADLDSQEFKREHGAAFRVIGHKANKMPLRSSEEDGFISTFQAAVMAENTAIAKSEENIHVVQARKDQSRFLLVIDEAQFCGLDKDGGGTKAAQVMQRLMELAAHTLIMTGTPYRADGQRVIGCEYSINHDNPKFERLIWHVRATLKEGLANDYLRPPEFYLHPGLAKWESSDGLIKRNIDITQAEDKLKPILASEDVFSPLVDDTIEKYRERVKLDRRYCGLITCGTQSQARAVLRYAKANYPDIDYVCVLSDPSEDDGVHAGAQAHSMLRAFRKRKDGGILITVRMVFIGFDHKPITVICVLTHYRHEGHLRQILGRGLRMWIAKEGELPAPPIDEQWCFIIGPDDPRFAKFAEKIRKERDDGLHIRNTRISNGGSGSGTIDEGVVTDADMGDPRAASIDTDLDADDLKLIEDFRQEHSLHTPPTEIRKIIDNFSDWKRNRGDTYQSSREHTNHRTRKEDLEAQRATCQDWAKKIAGLRLNRQPGRNWSELMREIIGEAHNGPFGDQLGFIKNGDLSTMEDLKTREDTLRKMYSNERKSQH